MQGHRWLLAAVILCTCGSGVNGQCWDIAGCAYRSSEEKITECMWQCRPKQPVTDAENRLSNLQQSTAEEEEKESLSLGMILSSLAKGDVLQAKRSSTGPFRSNDQRSYSMEHFRWGKPMGRKRRPTKVYTSSSVDEEGPEEQSVEATFPSESRRQLGSGEDGAPAQKKNSKSTEKYRMTHFRWNAPPATKRYGGFMKPYSEKSNKPFITLLRNIIIKDGQ